jgi:hypothetical protein
MLWRKSSLQLVQLRGQLYIPARHRGAHGWIEKELGEVESIINAHREYWAMIGSCGMASVLEKAGCNYIKSVREASFDMAVEDIKTPSNSFSMLRRGFLWIMEQRWPTTCCFGIRRIYQKGSSLDLYCWSFYLQTLLDTYSVLSRRKKSPRRQRK